MMQLCDVFPANPLSSDKRCWLSIDAIRALKPNASVFVPTSALAEFATRL
jgi:hypothetical protein